MQIKKVGVVGCGLMGHGIAQVAAQGGCTVVAVETEQRFLDAGLARFAATCGMSISSALTASRTWRSMVSTASGCSSTSR